MTSTDHWDEGAPAGEQDAAALRPVPLKTATCSVTHDGNSMSPSPALMHTTEPDTDVSAAYGGDINCLGSRGSEGDHLDDSEPRDDDSSLDVLKVVHGHMDLVGKDNSEKVDVSFVLDVQQSWTIRHTLR